MNAPGKQFNSRVPIFLSYAHEDKAYLELLLTHLEPLKIQNMVCAWSDLDIQPGAEWSGNINSSIQNASACILLISQYFLASKYIRESELPYILDRMKEFNLPILPLIVRPCIYDLAIFKYPDPNIGPNSFEFRSIQTVNDPNYPLSTLPDSSKDIIMVGLARQLYNIYKAIV